VKFANAWTRSLESVRSRQPHWSLRLEPAEHSAKGGSSQPGIGLVPREFSTGGKQKLLGISKRGNSYLRKLFVQGARAVLQFRDKQCPGLKHWLAELASRSHYNIVGVALATKLARMAWAALASGNVYRPPDLAGLQMTAV